MEIAGQACLITGAASGMGAACAKKMTQLGAHCLLLDRDEKVHDVARELNASAAHCDVASSEQAQQALDSLFQTAVPRVLINCAGICPAKRMVAKQGPMPLEEFSRVIEINLIGSFNIMRLFTAKLLTMELIGEERGVIINTASIAAYEGQIGQAAYSASKGGIVSMTLPLARELAQFAVRINAIAPGIVATPLIRNMPQSVQQDLQAAIPFPKRFAQESEFADLVAHIISNAAINGTVIRMDCALRMS